MSTLKNQLDELKPEEKRALADWLWISAEKSMADLPSAQTEALNRRAEAALGDAAKRFPLGDAEKKLRR